MLFLRDDIHFSGPKNPLHSSHPYSPWVISPVILREEHPPVGGGPVPLLAAPDVVPPIAHQEALAEEGLVGTEVGVQAAVGLANMEQLK